MLKSADSYPTGPMPRIVFVLPDGSRREVNARAGASVMRAAVEHGIRGIEAECGGTLSCGTCHVFVEGDWHGRLPAPVGDETGMLDFTAVPAAANSRLSCQLVVTDALAGATFRIPERQT